LGTKSEKLIGCKNNRVDLDVLNGSAYKNKTKNDWTAEVWRGIKTTAFASIHGDYWLRHTSPRVAVTTSDILVPMALGVGLGILHAQITAYDPQRLKRKRPSPPASFNSTADIEPPQSPTSLPVSSPPLPSEVNFSNAVDSTPQLQPTSTRKPDKEVILSGSNHVIEEINDQTNSCGLNAIRGKNIVHLQPNRVYLSIKKSYL
uniref:Reverse transcriptase domain-containing protein n=1 Tax=Rodentolepis nana TaxID=102285 RepID=A0A0R3TEU6_RODNA